MDEYKSTVYRVCLASELEIFTRSGWRLVQVLNCSQAVTLNNTKQAFVPPYQPYQNASYTAPAWQPIGEQTNEVGNVPMFLLSLDDNSVIGAQTTKISELETKITELEKKQSEHASLTKTHLANFDDALGKYHSTLDELSQSRIAVKAEVAIREKLDAELTKIRNVIGIKQFKEILAGA